MNIVDDTAKPARELTVKERAKQELIAERTKDYVIKMKQKLKDIEAAKIVVSNIEREILDLELKIQQETDALK